MSNISLVNQSIHARQELVRVAAGEIYGAMHGKKTVVANDFAARLGVTLPTLYKEIERMGLRPADAVRKRRSDAGVVSLDTAEALKIAALIKQGTRANGKRIASVGDVVDVLRANGEIAARRIDRATGEVVELSHSAIHRALRAHGAHADQLNAPRKHTALASLHPNHVWEMDFSVCVLFYLASTSGLQVMDEAVFNKNKPKNLTRVERDRVQRVLIVDHTTGAFVLRYLLGAETALNAIDAFIWATQPKDNHVMHGVPLILYTDQGPGFKSAPFDTLMRRLMVRHIRHEAGNARATGSVEVHNNIIERSFESMLRTGEPVQSLLELNARAEIFQAFYQTRRVHSRHNMTRFDAWAKIESSQLRLAPAEDVMRALPTSQGERRQFRGDSTVAWSGRVYDLKNIPGLTDTLRVGEFIEVFTNPYTPNDIVIVRELPDKTEQQFLVSPQAQNGWKFSSAHAIIGEQYKSQADGPQEAVQKAIDETMSADRIRALNPTAHMNARDLPEIAAQGSAVSTSVIFAPPTRQLSITEAARALREIMGVDVWTKDHYATLERIYPDGVLESELDQALTRITTRNGLRVIAGGAA